MCLVVNVKKVWFHKQGNQPPQPPQHLNTRIQTCKSSGGGGEAEEVRAHVPEGPTGGCGWTVPSVHFDTLDRPHFFFYRTWLSSVRPGAESRLVLEADPGEGF